MKNRSQVNSLVKTGALALLASLGACSSFADSAGGKSADLLPAPEPLVDCVSYPDPKSGAPQKPICSADFYQAPKVYGVVKNLVIDYGVNNKDKGNDSPKFQKAINEISATPNGGKLEVPAGDYYLNEINVKSNVHIEFAEGATVFPSPHKRWNKRLFNFGEGKNPRAENTSIVGLGEGFTVDFRRLPDAPGKYRAAVFNLSDVRNFKISNVNIQDNKSIFSSVLTNVTNRKGKLYWPVNGVIEKIDQHDSLFGYGIVQTYGADNLLFRELSSDGGVTLRMETDHLSMKKFGQGGIRDIYAEDISCKNGLAAVMFSPHFQQNGKVLVNGVASDSCGFAVRSDPGSIELFSPKGKIYTRQEWMKEVDKEIGPGCAGVTYGRGVKQWATKIKEVNDCIEVTRKKTGMGPGTYEESYVFNVTATYGETADLKQYNLDYLTPAQCENVCMPSYNTKGQIYYGPAVAGVVDETSHHGHNAGDFKVHVKGLKTLGFPTGSVERVLHNTPKIKQCAYYKGRPTCP